MANTLISGTGGNDSIYDYGENYYYISNYSTINAGKGNDSVFVGYHTNLSVYGGAGSDTINSWRYAVDSTLNGGAGDDSIYNEQANSLSIIGEAGKDTIYSNGWGNTINGGKDNDLISLQSASNLIIYNSGDGNDTIWGFNSTDSIKITGATYSTTKSGSDVIIKVGNGRINLKNVEGNAIQINGENVGGNSTKPNLVILNNGGDEFWGNLDDITIIGGAGNDFIINGDGLDKLSSSMNVSISGGAGDDYISTSAEEEHIPYKLIKSPDNSTLNGGTGNDTIINHQGANVLFQYANGDGNDSIEGFNETSTLSISGGSYSTTKSGNDIIVTVGNGKISLIDAATLSSINISNTKDSSSASKLITLTEGNDNYQNSISGATIQALGGSDTVYNTSLTSNVLINGGAGKDYIENGNVVNYSWQGGGSNVTINGGAGNDSVSNNGDNSSIIGGEGNDSIISNGSKVTISGGDGSDTIGNDDEGNYSSISGGDGDDRLLNFGKYATVNGGKGNDTLYTNYSSRRNQFLDFDTNVTFQYAQGDGNDIISGFRADSTLSISGGSYSTTKSDDNIIVTVGNGKISLIGAASLSAVNIKGDSSGGSSSTTLTVTDKTKSPVTVDSAIKTINASKRTTAVKITGNTNANTISGGSKNDTINGGAGNDSIIGNAGNDSILGNAGNDRLYGNGGNDKLYGNTGNDRLYGNSGNDSLWGGAGNDSLWGGKGTDVFTFLAGQGTDYVMDYDSGELLRIYNSSGKSKVSFSKSVFSKDTLTLTINGGGTIILDDVGKSDTFNINGTSYKISGSKLAKK